MTMKRSRAVVGAASSVGGLIAACLVLAAQVAEAELGEVTVALGTFSSLQSTDRPPLPFSPFPDVSLYVWGDGLKAPLRYTYTREGFRPLQFRGWSSVGKRKGMT
jgi:hypothetical protein